jgi:hypothetical protein
VLNTFLCERFFRSLFVYFCFRNFSSTSYFTSLLSLLVHVISQFVAPLFHIFLHLCFTFCFTSYFASSLHIFSLHLVFTSSHLLSHHHIFFHICSFTSLLYFFVHISSFTSCFTSLVSHVHLSFLTRYRDGSSGGMIRTVVLDKVCFFGGI